MAALARRLALLVLLLLATRLHPAAAELDDELEEAPDASSSASTLKRKLSPLEPVACPLVHAKRPRQIAPKFPGCKSSYDSTTSSVLSWPWSGEGLHFKRGKYEEMMKAYKSMLTYIK